MKMFFEMVINKIIMRFKLKLYKEQYYNVLNCSKNNFKDKVKKQIRNF